VGSMNGRLRRLEGRIGPPQDTDEEKRRARVIAELQRMEARLRSMSPEEHKAWRESPEWAAEKEALEAELERRRRNQHRP
jgi:hypothetical protein